MRLMNSILVIEDEASLRESLEMYLTEGGFTVYTAGDGQEGLTQWRGHKPQVIILDIRLPDVSGLELLPKITGEDPEVKVIMITAFHDMETTIEAMRLGAFDYIRKPLKVGELDEAIKKALHIARVAKDSRPMLEAQAGPDPGARIVGNTAPMQSIFKTIGLLSRNRASVLIVGETGSGKELIARVIHESSQFSDQPFVTIDCTTLNENLLESELFGHERGAFTGAHATKKGRLELAGSGSIFFDEVGELPLALQAKLLRFLEYREFMRVGGTKMLRSAARIIAATNRSLDEMAASGEFRADLLFRLKVMSIVVPPLRLRLDDLPELVEFFLGRINTELGLSVTRVEDQAMERLRDHAWPGNVRELRNVLTKAALESRGAVLLADAVAGALAASPAPGGVDGKVRTLREVEAEHILAALTQCDWNITNTAKTLGVSRPTLRKRMERYGIRREAL